MPSFPEVALPPAGPEPPVSARQSSSDVQTTGVWLYIAAPDTAATRSVRPPSVSAPPARTPSEAAAFSDSTTAPSPTRPGAAADPGRTPNADTAAVRPPASAFVVTIPSGSACRTPGTRAQARDRPLRKP